MNPTGKTYPLHTINDLIAIPPERRNACVAELLEGIATAERAVDETRRKIEAMPMPRWLEWLRRRALRKLRVELREFRWVDDGLYTAAIRLQSPFGAVARYTNDHRTNPL